ncbi:MAG: acetate--CoA ligase alpha subunit [Candidatus Odinarchaeia archaeon]
MTAKTKTDLKALFTPESVCVIGASKTPGKVGHDILKNIIDYGFKGKIYPINPKYKEIYSLRCYPKVEDIEDNVDLAVIAIPARFVPDTVKQCGEKGVKSIVIISAGFKEIGRQGAKLEREILQLSKKYNIRIQGPNCLGVINTAAALNASFAGQMPKKGNIAFISQSGAMGTAILDWSFESNIGFSKFISLGNKVDLDESDFISALSDDPQTKVILLYLEDVKDGENFVAAVKKTIPKKPILILKAGQSASGRKAAVSHTGSLAGSNIAYKTIFKQYGIIEVDTISDLFDYALTFSTQPIPKDSAICILTNAGGPGIITTDATEKNDLKLARFKEETIRKLQETLPPSAALYNPVDILGDAPPERYYNTLKILAEDENISAIIILLSPQVSTKPTETAYEIMKLKEKISKTLVCVFMGGPQVEEARNILSKNKIPTFSFPEDAVESVAAMVKYSEMREYVKKLEKNPVAGDKQKVKEIFSKVRQQNRINLIGVEALEVLKAYNIKTPETILADNSEEAVEFADKIGYPVVLKIESPDILHKTDVGGVALNIKNEKEVKKAFVGMVSTVKKLAPKAKIYGVQVQKQNKKGTEIIIGVSKDVQFGHLLMFGLGGIYVNFLKDVSFRAIPVYKGEAFKMIKETKTYNLLKGVRGQPPSDIDSIIDVVYKISQLIEDFPQITELDINPLFTYEVNKGSLAVDAKITLSK